MGSLLEPIDAAPSEGDREGQAVSSPAWPQPSAADALRTHVVADGDTLSRLAAAYLGRADRYLEIFELNRPLLSSPDLLPIGATLKIPSRGAGEHEPSPVESGPPDDDAPPIVAPLKLVPVRP